MTVVDDKKKLQAQKSSPQVWVALIGALASIAVAAIAAKYQAKPAAATALDDRVGEVTRLRNVVNQASQEAAALKRLPVGTIIGSMLSVPQMANEGGDLWVPADGRNSLPDWKYTHVTGETKLPDLRGMFLRGVNDSDVGARQDEKQDPEANRRPGFYQPDAVGSHAHTLLTKYVPFKQGGGGDFAANIFSEGGFNKPVDGAVIAQSPPGETRPRNTAVRWFIKVN